MRLLYVHEVMGGLGGAEANAVITAGELKRRGAEVGLVWMRRSGRGEAEWQRVFSSNWAAPEDEAGWQRILGEFRPDAVYMHKWEHNPSLAALGRSGVPLVRMVHDHDLYCLRSYKYHPLTRRICCRAAGPWCVFPCLAPIRVRRGKFPPIGFASYPAKLEEIRLNRAFRRHLVVTEYMKGELVANGFDPARIEIFPPVPRPVDPLESTFGPRNLLVYAGQIIRGKGVDVLLRALARLQEPFEAVILGDGNHRGACERLSRRLGISGKVRFAGFLPQPELRGYYAEATAAVIPSVWPEPIATVGLEVMRYGLPVVAFDAGGIRDWLRDGENGFLVPWMDDAAFADRLGRLLRDKGLARRMGEAGRKIVARDYDFDAYIGRLEDLFRRVGGMPA
ncbi:MAG: glycosyltransferase family 4 protein [Verrucomicrobiia bacterium]